MIAKSILDRPIAVIGAGSWGTALSLLLARNGNIVRLWGEQPDHLHELMSVCENRRYLPGFIFPTALHVVMTLAEALAGIQDVLIAVPSHAFRAVLQQINALTQKIRIVWGTKGLDPSTRQLLHYVVADIFSDKIAIAALAGPSFAKEVAAEKPTAISLAGNNSVFIDDLVTRLSNPYFRVYKNSDLIGVEVCGVLKNILAIATGIADGLQLGANTRAALMTRGLVEMGRLSAAMGADNRTLMSLAGVGDLILSCTDDQSRNRCFGKAIGLGETPNSAAKGIGQAIEGLYNVAQVYQLAQRHQVEMPITHRVYRILYESADPRAMLDELLARPLQAE